jgi:uncharacterized membrane protein YgcG
MFYRAFVFGIVLLSGFALPGPLWAVAPEIKDDGKFFSAEAVKKANKQIREIARKYERDLLIETFPTVPGGQAERVKAMAPEERDKFFLNWASDRAEAAVVHGVYILVCKEPAHLEVVITKKAKTVFDKEAFQKLRDLLLKHFREKHYDEGLQAAVDFVQEKLAGAASK